MAMTAAERQKRYRERNGRNAGKRRINLIVAASVVVRLDELARQYGVYKQEMLERAILEYGSLLRSDMLIDVLSPEKEAERLLALADGDAARALALLNDEAKRLWPDFTWTKAAAKQAPPEYKRLHEMRRFLRKEQKRPLGTKSLESKESQAQLRTDQLMFAF